MWTIKSPGLVAEIEVQRSTMSKVPNSPCVVKDILTATLCPEAQGPQAEIHLCAVLGSISWDRSHQEAITI